MAGVGSQVVIFVGVLAAIGFVLVSGGINLFYALSAAKNLPEAVLFGSLSVCSDLVKAFGLVWFSRALKNWKLVPAISIAVVWIACVGFAMLSAYDFSKKIRTGRAGEAAGKYETLTTARAELRRAEDRRNRLGAYDPPSVVEQKLSGLRLQSAWSATKQCSETTTLAARTFCSGYRALEVELARGVEAGTLDTAIAVWRGKIETLGSLGAVDSSGDDLAAGIARLTGLSIVTVQDWLPFSMVMVIEIGSMFLLYGVLEGGQRVKDRRKDERATIATTRPSVEIEERPLRPLPPRRDDQKPIAETSELPQQGLDRQTPAAGAPVPPTPVLHAAQTVEVQEAPKDDRPVGAIDAFALDLLQRDGGVRMELGVLHTKYCAWCESTGAAALKRTEFEKSFLGLCERVGWTTERVGRKVFCLWQLAA